MAPRPRPWEQWVRSGATERPVVLAGSGVDHLPWLSSIGATVVGAIGVAPGYGGLPAPQVPYDGDVVDVYGLGSPVRSVSDLQSFGYADALRRHAGPVRRFLDGVDPDREAAVVSLYATPPEVTGGRPSWAVDATLAERLETKASSGAVLDEVLDWIETRPAPDRPDDGWWRGTTEQLHTDRLVVQRTGMNCAGSATWICRSADELREAVARCPGGTRVTPFVEGTPVNVMAAVVDGAVLVVPPSTVIGTVDPQGRPRYAGNVTGRLTAELCRDLADDARGAGVHLASLGYRGPFGLDAIVTPDGRRRHHDLNARVNGSARLFNVHVPLLAALLVLPAWLTPERAPIAEAELWSASEERPLARLWLRETVGARRAVASVPPGRYRFDPDGPAEWIDAADDPATVSGDVVLVRSGPVSATRLRPGDDVVHGDLFADPYLHDALVERHGRHLVHAVIDRLRSAVARG